MCIIFESTYGACFAGLFYTPISDCSVYVTLVICLFRAGKGHLPTRQFIKMDRLIPLSSPFCFQQTVPGTLFHDFSQFYWNFFFN